jgi:hypothetical protein
MCMEIVLSVDFQFENPDMMPINTKISLYNFKGIYDNF